MYEAENTEFGYQRIDNINQQLMTIPHDKEFANRHLAGNNLVIAFGKTLLLYRYQYERRKLQIMRKTFFGRKYILGGYTTAINLILGYPMYSKNIKQ